MQQAFRKGDRQNLTTLLPQAAGHAGALGRLLGAARTSGHGPARRGECLLQRWAGSHQEDRLRNDWLLLLGQRRDWEQFAELHPTTAWATTARCAATPWP